VEEERQEVIRELPIEGPPKGNMTGFVYVPPAVAFSILDYIIALDTVVNFEYRISRMISFSKRSIIVINEEWGVPKPYNYGVFGALTLVALLIFKRVIGSFFGGKGFKQANTA